MAKWFWHHKIISIVLIIALGIAVSIFIKSNTPPKMEKGVLRRGTISTVVEASGKVKANETADLSFSLPGIVDWVGIQKGDTVGAYQILATMDQREIENTIKNKLLEYMKTRSTFDQGRADKNITTQNPDSTSLSDAEKRILQSSQYGLDQSVLDVELATLAREKAQLVSPINGTVINDGNLLQGESLGATNVVSKTVRITNLDTLYFEAMIDEIDYAKVFPGQQVTIKLDSYPDATINGTVTYLGKEGIKKTGGSVQIPVDISINSIPGNLVPELNGEVQIVLRKKTDTLILDRKFVHKDGNKFSVSVLEKNKPVSKPVTIGLEGINSYEITSGLKEGDTVVNIVKSL